MLYLETMTCAIWWRPQIKIWCEREIRMVAGEDHCPCGGGGTRHAAKRVESSHPCSRHGHDSWNWPVSHAVVVHHTLRVARRVLNSMSSSHSRVTPFPLASRVAVGLAGDEIALYRRAGQLGA